MAVYLRKGDYVMKKRLELRLVSAYKKEEKIEELEGLKALVVDDDFDTCDSVTKMLRRVGMRSDWTVSGKEAVPGRQHCKAAADGSDSFVGGQR